MTLLKSIDERLNEFFISLYKTGENKSLKKEDFSLGLNDFNLFIEDLEQRGFIKGSKFLSGEYHLAKITLDGHRYLEKIQSNKNEVNNMENNEDKLTNKIDIPILKFDNLPEGELKFSTWIELHDWVHNEIKEWEHWYDYIADMSREIGKAINIHRSPMVALWKEAIKLKKQLTERDYKRYSRLAEKKIKEVNNANPIISYSELGKKMIETMDDNPDEALKKYQNKFLSLLKNKNQKKVTSQQVNPEIKNNLEELASFEISQYKKNLGKIKTSDLNRLQNSVDKLKKYNLKELYNNLKDRKENVNEEYFKALEEIKDLDFEDFQKSLDNVKKMDIDKELNLVDEIEEKANEISETSIIKEYESIVEDYKNRNLGNAFNSIQDEKDKIQKLINTFEVDLKDEIKNENTLKVNEIETKLDKYKKIKKEYKRIELDAIMHTTNAHLEEKDLFPHISDYLIELGYPKENISIEDGISIVIKYENKILAVIIINMLKNVNSDEQLKSIFKKVLEKHTNILKLYLIYPLDSVFSFYEYDIDTNKYDKVDSILSFKNLIKYTKPENNIYPHLDNDTPDENVKDSLSISNDVNAFAKLISYKGLIPPLSIGLFGEWGSGKSFFMKELQNKIDLLSDEGNTTFIKNILHIRFNAWYYSDTNLWASLIYKIFNEINNEINQKSGNKNETEKNELYKELKSVKEAIEYKENEKSEINQKLTNLRENKASLEIKIDDEIDKIKALKFQDYYKLILEDSDVQNDLNNLKDELLLDNTSDIKNIKKDYEEISTFWGKLKKVNKLLIKNKKEFRLIVFILTIVNVGFYCIFNYTDIVKNFNLEMTTILSTIGIYSLFIKNGIRKVSPFIDRFKKILTRIDDLKDKKHKNEYSKIHELEKESLIFEKQKNELENKISKLENSQFKIEKEIEDINNGKFFKRFISDKVSSNDYTKHLGLISLIRDDLLELEEYLLKDETVKIERIILYIDDLDRCSDETVVNVLEAIHLILAFKLFVVIVGIDIKWINGALKARHKRMFDDGITPKQYIEKIFQIPFKIKEIDTINKVTFIDSLLKNDILAEFEVEKEVSPAKPVDIGNAIESDAIQLKKLKIRKEELDFINKYSVLIGNTPRTIKRFINIYRILRSHNDVNDLIYDENNDYKIVILLLCQTFSNKDDLRTNNYLDDEDLSYYNSFDFDRRMILKSLIERFSF